MAVAGSGALVAVTGGAAYTAIASSSAPRPALPSAVHPLDVSAPGMSFLNLVSSAQTNDQTAENALTQAQNAYNAAVAADGADSALAAQARQALADATQAATDASNALTQALAAQAATNPQAAQTAVSLAVGYAADAKKAAAAAQKAAAGAVAAVNDANNQLASVDDNGGTVPPVTLPTTTIPPTTIPAPTTTAPAPTTTSTPPTTLVVSGGQLVSAFLLDPAVPTDPTCATYAGNGTTNAGKCLDIETTVQNPTGAPIAATIKVTLGATISHGFEVDGPLPAGWACTDTAGKPLNLNTDAANGGNGTEIHTAGFTCAGTIAAGQTLTVPTSSGSKSGTITVNVSVNGTALPAQSVTQ